MTRKRRPDPRIRDKNLRTLMQDNRKYINALINAATQRDEMAESRERYKKAYLRRHRALEQLQKEHDALLEHAEKLEAVLTDRLEHDTKMVEIRKEYNGCLIRPD